MGRLHFWFSWLMHFFAANSRHGTHSPFVYRLVDEVVYPKRRPGEPHDKVDRLVERLMGWFRPNTVHDMRGNEQPPVSPIDFIVADCICPETLAAQLEALWPQLHAGSALVLLGCHRTVRTNALWQSIKTKPEVTVTIDLFHVGLVFFHAGQARENFKIRY